MTSALDQIRAIHAAAEGRRRLIDLPVWWSSQLEGHDIVLRCAPLGQDRLAAILAQSAGGDGQPDPARAGRANAALLAEATVDIRVIEASGADTSLDPEGGPIRFEPRLATLMGWADPPATAVGMVERFVRTAEAPMAVAALAGALASALSGGIDVAAKEALGE